MAICCPLTVVCCQRTFTVVRCLLTVVSVASPLSVARCPLSIVRCPYSYFHENPLHLSPLLQLLLPPQGNLSALRGRHPTPRYEALCPIRATTHVAGGWRVPHVQREHHDKGRLWFQHPLLECKAEGRISSSREGYQIFRQSKWLLSIQ